MPAICNIAAYKFVALPPLPELSERLSAWTEAEQLKGTILLAEEGINLFLAGEPEGIDRFLSRLRQIDGLADLEVKRSFSETIPFKKMRVKIKREIIRMDHPAIQPQAGRAPAVDAARLQRWIARGTDDEGRPLLLLDTRNDFEVDAGTFRGAVDWRLKKFTEFPQAVQTHREALRGKTIVSFCTGGIRCEKAAIYMAEAGVDHVYQLDGGILKYFEETGGAGFEGNCFVFDERRALNSELAVEPYDEPGAESGAGPAAPAR
jgi:UPF0176 protein